MNTQTSDKILEVQHITKKFPGIVANDNEILSRENAIKELEVKLSELKENRENKEKFY